MTDSPELSKLLKRKQVIRTLCKRLKFRSDKELCANLNFAGMGCLEAYKLGAQEAQDEMIRRIEAML